MNHLRFKHAVRLAYHTTRRWQHSASNQLPVQLDLLERYRSLVASGQINYDEDQIRVVMQLRRLQKTLLDYAPPALTWRLIDQDLSPDSSRNDAPWWLYRKQEASMVGIDKALVRVKSHADEIEALTTPKVSSSLRLV